MATTPGGNVMQKLENPSPTMGNVHTSIDDPNHKTNPSREMQRGRARGRVAGKGKPISENVSPKDEEDLGAGFSSADEGGPPRKRRRSRKGLDKKYECTFVKCGKAYSRSEHLLRHQLNHYPTKIFRCDSEGCEREFVRQDLCNRHRERHRDRQNARLPDFQRERKDADTLVPTPAFHATNHEITQGPLSPETIKAEDSNYTQLGHFNLSHESVSSPFSYTANHPTDISGTAAITWFSRSTGDHTIPPPRKHPLRSTYVVPGHFPNENERPGSFPTTSSVGFFSPLRPPEAEGYDLNGMQTLSQASPFLDISNFSNTAAIYHNIPQRSIENDFPQQNFNPPQFMLGNVSMPQSQGLDPTFAIPQSNQSAPVSLQNDPSRGNQTYGNEYYEDLTAQAMPFLWGGGGEGYERSPIAMGDNLVNFFFVSQDGPSSLDSSAPQPISTYSDIPPQFLQNQWYPQSNSFFPRTMAVNTILQPTLPEKRISNEKAEKVFQEIQDRFNEREDSATSPVKKKLLEGDRSQDDHLLSTKKMQIYIELFFEQFHLQVPILHQPTFTADKTPNLLLIAIMAIGAACLDRNHEYEISQLAASLSNFLAWYLRWELFSHRDFLPPGKLWMIQTLLLLEMYEKMYSNRMLHERAHIHHATTITLMRRGRSMTNHAIDTLNQSPGPRDERQQSPLTEDTWWNNFIEIESTHRAAYAAFLIDSTHAVMFGHSSNMYVYELALPLPCNEKIWAATTGAEAWRLHTNFKASASSTGGSFLTALQKIIHGQEVETNSFGRTVVMAGLLNILWQMKQRDRQLSGLLQTLKLKSPTFKWKPMLQDAFDNWANQCDCSHNPDKPYNYRDDLVSENRTVLHHLAHMAMHVDIIECQIYAHAEKLLGRIIPLTERTQVIKKWRDREHKIPEMRDAVFYALQFLRSALIPDQRMRQSHAYKNEDNRYKARDDPLLNRPWVLYFAALLIFCYGNAKEGPSKVPIPAENRPGEQQKSMREFLIKFHEPRNSRDPHYLATMTGFNDNSGLLMVVRSCLKDCRWDLLKEAEKLLTNCIRLNSGQQMSD